MIAKKSMFLFLFWSFQIAAFAQPTSDAEWNQYFNMLFLPENSPEHIQAVQQNEPRMMMQESSATESISRTGTQKKVSSTTDHAPQAFEKEADLSESTDSDFEESALQLLPERIARVEKNPGSTPPDQLYDQYQREYPLHENVYLYARSVLNSVAHGGWLIVQGHLDTYPIRALQLNENFRSDVTIVNLSWVLEDAGYRTATSAQAGATVQWPESPDAVSVVEALHHHLGNKTHLSLTLQPEVIAHFSGHLKPAGLVFSFDANPNRHHEILTTIEWNRVTDPSLPEYVKALQQNYIAALLLHQKMELPPSLGLQQRADVLEKLYEQRSLRSAGQHYLESE